MAKKRYSIDMTTGSLFPKILTFTIPLLLTGILQLVYNAADVMVVGKYVGSQSLAAVGATTNLVQLLTNLFIGLSTGSGVVAAKYIGASDGKATHRSVQSAMLLSIISGIVMACVGFFLSPSILRLMGTPEDILPLSVTYLKIFFLGTPASMIYNFGSSILRASGDSKRPLYMLIISGLVNVSLNLLFVIVFKMNVSGVALATIISQYLSALFIIVSLANNDGFTHLTLGHLRFYKKELIEIIKIGLPAGIQGSLFSVSNVLIQSSINSFGAVAIAGNTASASIDGIIYTSTNSVAQAAMTFTSQNYGAGKIKRIRSVYFESIGLAVLFCIILGLVFFNFSDALLSVFTSEPDVIATGSIRLQMFACVYLINSMLDVTTGQMRGLGKSVVPMAVTLAGVCGLRIVWIFTVFRHFHTYLWLLLSYPASWIITLLVVLVCYVYEYRKTVRKFTPGKEII